MRTASAGGVAQLQGGVSNLQGGVGRLQGSVSQIKTQLQQLAICIPQLQQEVNGLNVSTNSTGGYLTSAFLQSPTIVSQNCTHTLNGGA